MSPPFLISFTRILLLLFTQFFFIRIPTWTFYWKRYSPRSAAYRVPTAWSDPIMPWQRRACHDEHGISLPSIYYGWLHNGDSKTINLAYLFSFICFFPLQQSSMSTAKFSCEDIIIIFDPCHTTRHREVTATLATLRRKPYLASSDSLPKQVPSSA